MSCDSKHVNQYLAINSMLSFSNEDIHRLKKIVLQDCIGVNLQYLTSWLRIVFSLSSIIL